MLFQRLLESGAIFAAIRPTGLCSGWSGAKSEHTPNCSLQQGSGVGTADLWHGPSVPIGGGGGALDEGFQARACRGGGGGRGEGCGSTC